jgi:hypothetical protein
MNHRYRWLLLGLALTARPALADTVQASATTMLLAGQDYRNGSLQTAVPLYQLLNLDASDIKTPYGNLQVALSTWGSADLADIRFWQNGAPAGSRFTGDVNVAYVRGDFFDRRLSVKAGRLMVADGAARMMQLDGGEATVLLPAGFGLSGYIGSPVAPRFSARVGELAVGNVRGQFAAGGRAFWRYAGLLDVGVSTAIANDNADPSRRDVGADFRLTPHPIVTLVGSGWWSFYEQRMGEAVVAATFFPIRHLDITVDYRHVEPDLFLPRTSILSVFTSDQRNDVGGSVHWAALRNLALDVAYHALLEDQGTGQLVSAKATWHPLGPRSTFGAEYTLLLNGKGGSASIGDNGYNQGRLFAAGPVLPMYLPALIGTADLMGYFYERDVNGQGKSLSATATLAYPLPFGWRAALAGTAGSTPFLSTQFALMAKLVYEQTYVVREVR